MSEYKAGDRVLLKAKLSEINSYGVYILKTDRMNYLFAKEEDFIPVPDMTAEEAWDIAKKLFADYSNAELDEIFGKGWSYPKLMELTPQEAKAKIEAWEAKKEINVGDEVRLKNRDGNEYKFFVTHKKAGEISGFSGFGGDVFYCRDIEFYEKTGRHIDIEGLMKQIGGNDSE